MTDFAHFGEAVYQASGKQSGEFMADYKKGREAAVMQSIESSPIASAVIELAQRREFNGTVGDLLTSLDDYRPRGDTGWPKSAKGLSDLLKRYSPAMRVVGVSVEFEGKSNRGRKVSVCSLPEGVEGAESNVTTVTTVTKSVKSDAGDVGDDEIPRFSTQLNEHTPGDISLNNEDLEVF